ncbi:hypothetical protein J2776_005206 [Paraburkholderia caledonica]|uniref:Uncharacterized protein n=1 Tax=Paraburkholderia caledonica TaxID=134536 RepID=A0ABU1L5J4_9BURK|nr:hypothetical protein [Paraburkholderia caledonica]
MSCGRNARCVSVACEAASCRRECLRCVRPVTRLERGLSGSFIGSFQSGDRTVLPRQRTDLLFVGPSNRGGGDSNFMRIKPAKLVRLSFPQPRRGNAWTAAFVPVLQPSVLSATRDCPRSVLPPCGRSRDPLANVKQRTKMSWLQATVVYAHKPVDRISPTSRQGLVIQSTSRSNLGQRIGLRSRACALCSAVNP